MNIGLLQCDHVNEEFQHVLRDYNDAFEDLFGKHAPEVILRVYDVCHGELPQAVDECDGYIISGSRQSVYDSLDWIEKLITFVQLVHEHRHKMVGICFGHQMIAHALGGTVAKASNGWGVGIKSVSLQTRKSWMQPAQNDYQLILSHQDQVLKLPDGAEVLGGNEHCPVSIFAVGDHMLGIQAHPEFTRHYAETLLDSRLERVGQSTWSAAKATFDTPTDSATVARWIEAFFQHKG